MVSMKGFSHRERRGMNVTHHWLYYSDIYTSSTEPLDNAPAYAMPFLLCERGDMVQCPALQSTTCNCTSRHTDEKKKKKAKKFADIAMYTA